MINNIRTAAVLAVFAVFGSGVVRAETVMQQCGHQYQDAKAAGTLNGATWNQFRTDCAARLKAQSGTAAAPPAAAGTAAAPTQTANPLNPSPAAPAATAPAPAPTTAAETKPAPTGGRAAFLARQKQCGAEWRATKTTLLAQTPGLTWPKYLSQCNARLKAAGK